MPGCERMGGPLILHAAAKCFNEWCQGISRTLVYSVKQEVLEINNLIPYSNYTVEISAGRKEADQGLKFFHTQFRTDSKRESL